MDRIEQLLKQGPMDDLFGDFTVQSNNFTTHCKQMEYERAFSMDKIKATANKGRHLCTFCYKNREISIVYSSHPCKDVNGKVVCPVLRNYVCPFCGQTGDNAHTKKYCPLNLQSDKFEYRPWFRRLSNGIITTNKYHK